MRYSRRLYEIHEDFEALLQRIEAAEGEIDETLESELYKIELERDKKLENCCAVVKNARAEADLYDSEMKRLRAMKTQQEKIAERVEAYIAAHLLEGEKWASDVHKIGWRKSEQIELADDIPIEDVPDAYRNVEITLRKSDVKKDLPKDENGETYVPDAMWFVKLIKKQNIQVK